MTHADRSIPIRLVITFALLAAVACGGERKERPAAPPPKAAAKVAAPAAAPAPPPRPTDDQDRDEYVPAEFKSGADRWRDTGVYVDGKFVGLLQFAELPVALKPTFIKVLASAPKRYGTKETGTRWAKERRYRFTEYLQAIGLDLHKVKAVHVYGPRFSESLVATRKDFFSKKAQDWMFRFAGTTGGKAIGVVPEGFGNGTTADKISAVMIYVDKTPPVHDRSVGFILDGEVQTGVPYFGTPLRGGVRVYMDDRLVAYIKRQDLPQDTRRNPKNGELEWSLFEYLKKNGVDTAKVVEAWVVRNDKWQEKLSRTDLQDLWFQATPQAKGHIELGDAHVKASALVLRSQPVAAADVPGPDPEEI